VNEWWFIYLEEAAELILSMKSNQNVESKKQVVESMQSPKLGLPRSP